VFFVAGKTAGVEFFRDGGIGGFYFVVLIQNVFLSTARIEHAPGGPAKSQLLGKLHDAAGAVPGAVKRAGGALHSRLFKDCPD